MFIQIAPETTKTPLGSLLSVINLRFFYPSLPNFERPRRRIRNEIPSSTDSGRSPIEDLHTVVLPIGDVYLIVMDGNTDRFVKLSRSRTRAPELTEEVT